MKNQNGQSTIEFAFVIFAFIFFLSMSYNAVVSFAVYQYLSYANFMAARAYQPSRATPALQREKAIQTMQVYVPNVQANPSQRTSFAFSARRPLAIITGWTVPAEETATPFILEFEVPFITLPLGEEMRRTFGTFNLRTEVTLGRENTRVECRSFFEEFFRSMGYAPGAGGMPHSPDGMEDNGC